MSEIIEVEAGELVAALREHRKTVQLFQTSVENLDSAIAAAMGFMTSWIERLERLKGLV